jgi:hypothetical protein
MQTFKETLKKINYQIENTKFGKREPKKITTTKALFLSEVVFFLENIPPTELELLENLLEIFSTLNNRNNKKK